VILLAIELSTVQGSAAVVRDDRVIAEETWSEKTVRGQQLFRALPDLLKRASVTLEGIDVFVAGRGPGAYSGLRVAITAAQGLALPGGKPVFTVSSAEALALEAMSEADGAPVAVIGDARREQLWFGLFEQRQEQMICRIPWTLLKPAELPAAVPKGCTLVSADSARLSPVLQSLDLHHARWVREDRFPKASLVAKLAVQKMRAGLPSEALSPIYMHPAVAARS